MSTTATKKKVDVKSNVQQIMLRHPQTRNDDKLLMVKYWKEVDGLSMNSHTDFFVNDFLTKSTAPESITRARRMVQEEARRNNDQRFLPSNEVASMRKEAEQSMLDMVRNGEVKWFAKGR